MPKKLQPLESDSRCDGAGPLSGNGNVRASGVLDARARDWISHSPLVFLGTCNSSGDCYTSPRGGPPGFVRVLDDRRVAFADLSRNNKINNMRNLVRSDGIAMAFLIPGTNEMLSVKGRAILSTNREIAETVMVDGVVPRVSFVVSVQEASFKKGDALKRSGVWTTKAWPDIADMPSYAQIVRDHGKIKSMTVEQLEATLRDAYGPQWLWKSGGSDLQTTNFKPFEVSVDVARTAGEVFLFLSRFDNETSWNPTVVEATLSSGQPGEVGARYSATLAFTGEEMPATIELMESAAGRPVAHRFGGG